MAAAWQYSFFILTGTDAATRSGKCYGLSITNPSAITDGVFTINDGDEITIHPGRSYNVNPKGKLVTPVVQLVSGAIDVLIETVN